MKYLTKRYPGNFRVVRGSDLIQRVFDGPTAIAVLLEPSAEKVITRAPEFLRLAAEHESLKARIKELEESLAEAQSEIRNRDDIIEVERGKNAR